MATYFNKVNPIEMKITQMYGGLPKALSNNRGTGIKIAILDSGIHSHWDLNDRVIGGRNFTTDNAGNVNDYKDGLDSSGTRLASFLCAELSKNEDGTTPATLNAEKNYGGNDYSGNAPDAQIVVGKVKTNAGVTDLANLIAGINWAIEQQVNIIAMTYSTTTNYPELETAINNATNAGIKVVAPALSDSTTRKYPDSYENVIAVAGVGVTADKPTTPFKGSSYTDFAVHFDSTDYVIASLNDGVTIIWRTWGNAMEHVVGAGAGVIALMLQAYQEENTPLENTAQVLAELPKYCRQAPVGYETLVGAGILDFNKTDLPNVLSGETVEPTPIESNTIPPVITVGNVTHNSVELSWDYTPTEGDNVYYHIKRDGVVVREANDFKTIVDRNSLNASTSYSYTVAVMKNQTLVVESNAESVVTSSAPVEETPTEPVIEPNRTAPVLTIGTISHDKVQLSWSYTPAVGDNVSYVVKRNGVAFDDNKDFKSATDSNVQPSTTYNYTVAVYSNGEFVVESVSKPATTIEAPTVEPVIEYRDKYIYVNDGTGGSFAPTEVANGVIKKDAGRRSTQTKRYS